MHETKAANAFVSGKRAALEAARYLGALDNEIGCALSAEGISDEWLAAAPERLDVIRDLSHKLAWQLVVAYAEISLALDERKSEKTKKASGA